MSPDGAQVRVPAVKPPNEGVERERQGSTLTKQHPDGDALKEPG